jgi:hypothetical protein
VQARLDERGRKALRWTIRIDLQSSTGEPGVWSGGRVGEGGTEMLQ